MDVLTFPSQLKHFHLKHLCLDFEIFTSAYLVHFPLLETLCCGGGWAPEEKNTPKVLAAHLQKLEVKDNLDVSQFDDLFRSVDFPKMTSLVLHADSLTTVPVVSFAALSAVATLNLKNMKMAPNIDMPTLPLLQGFVFFAAPKSKRKPSCAPLRVLYPKLTNLDAWMIPDSDSEADDASDSVYAETSDPDLDFEPTEGFSVNPVWQKSRQYSIFEQRSFEESKKIRFFVPFFQQPGLKDDMGGPLR